MREPTIINILEIRSMVMIRINKLVLSPRKKAETEQRKQWPGYAQYLENKI